MTGKTELKTVKVKKFIDWELIEQHYRAGIKTVRQIASEYDVSHTAIQKRASKFQWVKDLTEKIQQTARNMVATQVVAKLVATETKLSESQTIQAYSGVIAGVDLMQRDDLTVALSISRSQMVELAALGHPDFRDALVTLGELLDKTTEDENGRERLDKMNELYQYIISLAGRVKMAKEIAGAHGVYIPLQRKVYGMDGKDSNASPYEDMLRSIARTGD